MWLFEFSVGFLPCTFIVGGAIQVARRTAKTKPTERLFYLQIAELEAALAMDTAAAHVHLIQAREQQTNVDATRQDEVGCLIAYTSLCLVSKRRRTAVRLRRPCSIRWPGLL